MSDEPTFIKAPLVIMFRGDDENVVCHLHPSDLDHRGYGLLICDLVRHIANAFKVEEDDVWDWVDKERHHHTTGITQAS